MVLVTRRLRAGARAGSHGRPPGRPEAAPEGRAFPGLRSVAVAVVPATPTVAGVPSGTPRRRENGLPRLSVLGLTVPAAGTRRLEVGGDSGGPHNPTSYQPRPDRPAGFGAVTGRDG